ncbi:hypothetical protein [Pseudactinotalea sp. Z1748]|uniref:hypothetical protein n=1 Tax=Pseudactinotalea sp. Z1748 TaxID=3413027 RepID=UPI003C7BD0EB
MTIAAALMWVAGALGLGVGVLALATDDLLVRELLPRFLFGHPPHGTGIRILELTLYLAAMAVMLTLALLAVAAFQGSNASRWVLVGLLGFWSLPTLLAGAVHPHPVSLLVGFGPAVVILLFLLPPASAWYRHQTSRRQWNRHLIEIQRRPGRRRGRAPGAPSTTGPPSVPGQVAVGHGKLPAALPNEPGTDPAEIRLAREHPSLGAAERTTAWRGP